MAAIVECVNNLAIDCQVDCTHPLLQPIVVEEILEVAFDRFNRRLPVKETTRSLSTTIVEKITDFQRYYAAKQGNAME